MQKKKCNHFVPQSYLRAFAADPNKRKIWTFKNDGGDFERRSIKKVAVSFYLYAPAGENGERDYSLEDDLASLENWFGEQFWHQVTADFVDLGDTAVRKAIALLASVMFLRNPLTLDVQRRIHSQFIDLYNDYSGELETIEIGGKTFGINSNDIEQLQNATDDDVKRIWHEQIRGAAWLAEIMIKMRWSILLTEEPAFITSDNPVSVVHPTLNFKGFRDPKSIVIFPLSPTRVLCLDNLQNEPDNQYYPIKSSPGIMNTLVFRNSYSCMFSHRHPQHVCQEICDQAERDGFLEKQYSFAPV